MNTGPLHRWLLPIVFLIGTASCASAHSIDDARRKYLASGDYASLQYLASHLKKAMTREQAETLLGPPDDEPVSGQCRYGTDRKELVEDQGVEMVVYLVLRFRDSKGNATNGLQDWGFAPHGE
jgi:hypothetical protein